MSSSLRDVTPTTSEVAIDLEDYMDHRVRDYMDRRVGDYMDHRVGAIYHTLLCSQ